MVLIEGSMAQINQWSNINTLSNMITTSQGLSKLKLSNINNLAPQSYCHISNAQ